MSESVRGFPAELTETWEPLGILGAGAMGKVYRVRHRGAGFEAAVKVTLAPEDARMRSRLLREAQALARVEHPGVVRVHDGGVTAGGDAFIVMERLEGYSLDEAPVEDPRGFMAAIAEALQAVHDAGLLHRDLKPGNLFMTRDGQPKLVDFGLALDAEQTRLTATGRVAGTPIYMAPEILRLEDPSSASDWYAFGVTLYDLLEGRPPFGSDEFHAALEGRPYPPPAFEKLDEGEPAREVLAGLLHSDADRRLVDVEEIRRGLAGLPLQTYAPEVPEPAGASGRSRGLVALALGAAVLGGFLLGGDPPEPVAPLPSPAPQAPSAEPLRALAATRKEWAAVDEAGRALYREPPLGRLFPASWYLTPIPLRYRHDQRNALLGEEGARLRERWERFVGATRAWLSDLRALGRERGAARAALEDPEVRERWSRELLPRLTRALEDQLLRWALSNNPAEVEIALLTPEGRGAMKAFINGSQELRFALEEWGNPPPPPLLHAWILLPRSIQDPIAHGPEVLDAVRRAIREADRPSELWWATRSLRVTLDFGPWFQDLPWQARLDALRELRTRLEALEMRPRHRAGIAAQLLPETARLGRARGGVPDVAAIQAEAEAWNELLRGAAVAHPDIDARGRFLGWYLTNHAAGPWVDDLETSEFRGWYGRRYEEEIKILMKPHGFGSFLRGEPEVPGLAPPRP